MFKATTISERATEQLRNDIIKGVYKAGDHITIKDIADKYNISAIPVREAFQRLNGEKLLEILPYKGAVVIGLTVEHIHDIVEINAILQGEFAARACLENPPADVIQKIEALHLEISKLDINDVHFMELDTEFHALFLSTLKNALVREQSDRFVQMKLFLSANHMAFGSEERKTQLLNSHQQIIDYFKQGDADAVRKSVFNHRMELNYIVKSCGL